MPRLDGCSARATSRRRPTRRASRRVDDRPVDASRAGSRTPRTSKRRSSSRRAQAASPIHPRTSWMTPAERHIAQGALAAPHSCSVACRGCAAEDEHEVLEGLVPARRVVGGQRGAGGRERGERRVQASEHGRDRRLEAVALHGPVHSPGGRAKIARGVVERVSGVRRARSFRAERSRRSPDGLVCAGCRPAAVR